MFKRKFWKQENVNFYLGWKNSITSGEFGNPFNSITSYNNRKLGILRSQIDLSAPIYARLLNGRFRLSEETFCKMLSDYRGECDLKTNEISEENQFKKLSWLGGRRNSNQNLGFEEFSVVFPAQEVRKLLLALKLSVEVSRRFQPIEQIW